MQNLDGQTLHTILLSGGYFQQKIVTIKHKKKVRAVADLKFRRKIADCDRNEYKLVNAIMTSTIEGGTKGILTQKLTRSQNSSE